MSRIADKDVFRFYFKIKEPRALSFSSSSRIISASRNLNFYASYAGNIAVVYPGIAARVYQRFHFLYRHSFFAAQPHRLVLIASTNGGWAYYKAHARHSPPIVRKFSCVTTSRLSAACLVGAASLCTYMPPQGLIK